MVLVDDQFYCKNAPIRTSEDDNYNIGATSYESVTYQESKVPNFIKQWATKTGSFASRNGSILDTTELVETDFCNDTSINEINEFGWDDNGNIVDKDHATQWMEMVYYGSKNTLKCNMKGLNNSSATRVKSKYALLTSTEVLLAGTDSNSYLLGDGGYGVIWSMTSYYADRGDAGTNLYYGINYYGTSIELGELDTVYAPEVNSYWIEPVIAINSAATIEADANNEYTANGTKDNPYVIN